MKILWSLISPVLFLLVLSLSFPVAAQRSPQSLLTVTESEVIPDIPVEVIPCGGMQQIMERWRPEILPDTTPYVQMDKQVGSIPYTSRIGDNGRVMIDVPIETFASDYEYAPQFTLSYNGSRHRDLLGLGWHIGGLPIITRESKDMFTDGHVIPINMSNDDAFYLDGVRLILTDTLENGVRRYLTQQGNTKVVYTPSTDSFFAYYADGSAVHLFATSSRDKYLPSSIRHLDGRTIVIDNNSTRLKASFGDGRSIIFRYKRVDNPATDYVAGHQVHLLNHVDSILVMKDDELVAGYHLGYLGSGASVDDPLSGVLRFSPDGYSMRWLVFAYNKDSYSYQNKVTDYQMTRHFNEQDMDKLIIARGKFDYGSEDDGFLMYPNRDPYYGDEGRVYADKYRSTDSIIVAARYLQDSLMWCQSIPVDDGFVDALAMDVDNVSGDEIVKIQNKRQNDSDLLLFTTYKFNGQQVVQTGLFSATRPVLNYNGKHSLRPKSFLSGDFDGDGCEELAIVYHANPIGVQLSAKVEFFDVGAQSLKGTFNLDSCYVIEPCRNPNTNDRIHYFKNNDRIIATDLDGDGKQELAIMGKRFITYYRFTRNGNSMTMDTVRKELPFSQQIREDYATHAGDFNGDGMGDLALTLAGSFSTGDGPGTIVYLGKGDGTHELKSWRTWEINRSYDCMVADVNRDGTTDIIYKSHEGYPTVRALYYRNGIVEDGMVESVADNSLVLPASVYANSSTNNSILVLEPLGKVKVISDRKQWDIAMQVNSIIDCNGNRHLFGYDRLFHQSSTIHNPEHYTFPYASFAEGMPVCSRHMLVSQGDTVTDERFSYLQPVAHRQGLGFCGFERVTMTDTVTGHSSVKWFEPDNFGVPVCDSTDISISMYRFAVTVSPNKRVKALMTDKTVADLATGVQVTSTYTHDQYGNVTTEQDDYGNSLSRTVERQYLNFDTLGYRGIGFELQKVETVTRGEQSMVAGVTTRYNAEWLTDSVFHWRENIHNVVKTEEYYYTDNKRLQRAATRKFAGDWQSNRFYYADYKQVPNSLNNGKGQITKTFYGKFGPERSYLLIDQTSLVPDPTPLDRPEGLGGTAGLNGGGMVVPDLPDLPDIEPSGLRTSYHYDTFGRKDSVITPDGAFKAISISWVDDVFPQEGYIVETTESGKPAIRTWYDPLGRKVKQAMQRFDGSWTYTLYEYDHRGRLYRESMPTITGTTSKWTTYSYDDFDRLTQKQYPDGHIDSCRYEGLSTTNWVDGVWTTRTIDAMGNLISVENAGGTLQYTLRPDGQPSAILAPGGVSTTFEYDQYGRRVAINDPSAGRRENTYDANGNVATEADSRGKSVTSTYNDKGLLTTRSFSDGIMVTYKYNKWNLPDSLNGSDGHCIIWTYNNANQLATETVDGFTKTYTYDKNVPISVAYSKGNDYICTENYSRMNGHLTSITLNTGDTLWTLRKQNARLLPTKVGLGRLSQSLSYDDRGNVRERVVTDRHDNELQWQECEYAATTGNMTERTDWLYGSDETFDYDNMNRLTDIEQYDYLLGYHYQSTDYDGKGNILSQTNAGQYGYGTARPYAFNELMSPSPLIPLRDQHISFNAMQRPDTIREGNYVATFDYYGDMSRALMTVTDTVTHNTETRTYYDQQYNEFTKTAGNSTQTKRVLWLGGTPYDAPAALVKRYGETDWTLVHVLRDNLGSITHVVDTTSTVLQEMGYSAWGLLCDPATLQPYGPDSQPELLLGRGYTGHEHLPWFGLVNMNARLYDPAVGRFLSPDPLVQAPDNTQNYNRYSYCLNNPLRWTDNTGLFFSTQDAERFRSERAMLQAEYNHMQIMYHLTDDPDEKKYWNDRAAQVLQSIRDINDMESNGLYEFQFGTAEDVSKYKITGPTTIEAEDYVFIIFTDGKSGSMAHELRHGGQAARDGYLENGSKFDVSYEVDAYRAQWGRDGFISYLPFVDTNNLLNVLIISDKGNQYFFVTIKSLSDITPSLIDSMYEGEGINIMKLYNKSANWYNSNNLNLRY